MPTTRKRYQVTETDEVQSALDAAAVRWPGESRSRLLVRVIRAGGESVEEQRVAGSRLAAVRRASGSYEDGFAENYLETLRGDRPV